MIYLGKDIKQSTTIYLSSIFFISCLSLIKLIMCAYPSHVGPVVGGAFLEEEQVEQEVTGGPEAPSCEECNLTVEQGKP
jgi:hypothetical protein